jgi:hypothetical protein
VAFLFFIEPFTAFGEHIRCVVDGLTWRMLGKGLPLVFGEPPVYARVLGGSIFARVERKMLNVDGGHNTAAFAQAADPAAEDDDAGHGEQEQRHPPDGRDRYVAARLESGETGGYGRTRFALLAWRDANIDLRIRGEAA